MPRVVHVPDIRKVDLPEARQAIPHVHAYLRECILDGTLTPGTKLSQVSLAAQLGISRTPLREVLRMLQEEGLVEIEPNQRTRVAGLDPQELDDVYASRILLETLALSMTIGHFGAKERAEAKRMLTAMRRAAKTGDFDEWFAAHTDYHRVCTAAAGEAMQRQLRAFADRTTRYIRIYQLSEPGSWQAAGDAEHAADPGGADRRRRAGRADRDGAPPGAHRAAGAGRLRAGLQAGAGAARGGAHRPRGPRCAAADRIELMTRGGRPRRAGVADRSWGWVMGRAVGPSHMSMEPGSAGSKVRGTQAASSSIRRTPKEYS